MAEIEFVFEQHMSDNEALMWNLEKDPALSSWFASLTILDQAPDMALLRKSTAAAVVQIPRLRQHVVASVGRWSPPMWVDDPEFDLDFHIRRVALPKPATEEALHDLAVKLLLDPFERSRPLWQYVVIEGLPRKRAAIFQKMHHTITDGEGGIKLAEMMLQLEQDVATIDVPDWKPGESPDAFPDSAREMIGHNVRRVGGIAQRVVTAVATNPVGTADNVSKVVAELMKALRPPDADGEQVGSPIWQPRTLKRWYGTLAIPFRDVKTAAKARGGTINDAFVAGALAGAAAYHADRDVLPDKFRIAMPVSTRSDDSAGGNNFALTTTDLPALVDPLEAFDAVRDALRSVKSGASVDILGSLSMIINLLPTSVLTSFAKEQAATVDFTVSNVRGAPFEVYSMGAKVEGVFPMGPISGTGFNLTTMSYAGKLDMGMVVDAGAIEDPPALRAAINGAYEKIIAG